MREVSSSGRAHLGLAIVLSLLSAAPVVGQRNPRGWRPQTTLFAGGSTQGAEGRLPLTPMMEVRLEASVKGYFWLGAGASWTFERDVLDLPGAGTGTPRTTSYNAVFTPLIVARLVNTPWSSGIYFVGRLGRVRDGRRPYTVAGGGLGFRLQRKSEEFLVAEARWMDRLGSSHREGPRWEFTVGFAPRGLPW